MTDTVTGRQFGPVTRTDIVRYQGASGDFSPLHHDEEFVRAAGYPTVFAVGMLHAGYLATYCIENFGAENVRRFRARFSEQVWPGDVLTCSATVGDAVHRDDGTKIVSVELVARRQTGGTAATAHAEVVLTPSA